MAYEYDPSAPVIKVPSWNIGGWPPNSDPVKTEKDYLTAVRNQTAIMAKLANVIKTYNIDVALFQEVLDESPSYRNKSKIQHSQVLLEELSRINYPMYLDRAPYDENGDYLYFWFYPNMN